MLLPLALLVALIALLSVESGAVWRDVNRLKRRVHVGGTRGKSTVTRYIAAGLRECGLSACGKVTGVRPTFIGSDGAAVRLKRTGGARVQEQFRIIRRAARQRADSLVLECMSITPELQSLESRFFRPHVFVMTKIRDDHREQLGEGEAQIEAMCSAIPRRAVVVTDDLEHRDIISQTAKNRGSRVVFVTSDNSAADRFTPDGVFAANLALALCVCKELGLDPAAALAGIQKEALVRRDRIAHLVLGDLRLSFVNGFAANDIESSQQLLEYWKTRAPDSSRTVVMLNTRSDRPLRSSLFASWLGQRSELSSVIILGDHAAYTHRALSAAGVASERIFVWRRRQVADVRTSLRSLGRGDVLVVGLGNIGGDGFRIADAFGVTV
jgi:poly-gamma-glutamate synthase PgsB/CapB